MSGNTIKRLALVSVSFLMYAAVIFYSWYTEASTVISRDQWHYVTMLTRYYDTGFDPSILLLRHGEHMELAYNAWFFMNGILFSLNTRFELFLGLLFLGGFVWILHKAFDASLSEVASPIPRRMMFVTMLMIALSFHQDAIFIYSLQAFRAFGETFSMIAFLFLLDRYLRGESTSAMALPTLAFLFLLLGLGFAGGGWLLHLSAAFATLLSWMITHTPKRNKILLLSWGLFSLGGLSLWINSLSPGKALSFVFPFTYVLQHLNQAVSYVITLFANSILDVSTLAKMNLTGVIYAVGAGVATAYLLAIYLFYKTRMWERTYIPFYLITFVWLATLPLLLYRLPVFGVVNAASRRYVTTLQIGLFGVLWVFFFAAGRKAQFKISGKIALQILEVTITALYLLHLSVAVKNAKYVRNSERNLVRIVRAEKFDNPSIACPHEDLCRKGIITLKEHHLNIYKEPEPIRHNP